MVTQSGMVEFLALSKSVVQLTLVVAREYNARCTLDCRCTVRQSDVAAAV